MEFDHMAYVTRRDKTYKTKEDICAHVGDEYSDYMGAVVPPIFQNSLFVCPVEPDTGESRGHKYTRISNPTTDIAERKIAALEGGEAGLCFSSGMGAISAAITYFVRKDCHVVLMCTTYGPTRIFLTQLLSEKFGVTVTCVKGDDTQEIFDAVKPETALIYLESPSSAVFKIQDLEAIGSFARKRGIGTVIDNSYATPLHQNPLEYGIDLVCHTASKYLGGHSDIVAGALVGAKEPMDHIQEYERALYGSNMDPHQAWLLIRGIRTLPLRLRQHGESGLAVASFLERHPKVKEVYYPGLDSFPQRELARKYLRGNNGLLSFVPDATPEQARRMMSACRYFQHGVSWGGFESLIIGISVGKSPEEAAALDIPTGLIRIHVGLENVDTLMEDLDQALNTM